MHLDKIHFDINQEKFLDREQMIHNKFIKLWFQKLTSLKQVWQCQFSSAALSFSNRVTLYETAEFKKVFTLRISLFELKIFYKTWTILTREIVHCDAKFSAESETGKSFKQILIAALMKRSWQYFPFKIFAEILF